MKITTTSDLQRIVSASDIPVVEVLNPDGASALILVCEHASKHVPAALNALGLDASTLQSHVAWDPGALAIAKNLSARFDAPLVASRVSRLVYDCNRPPSATGAVPMRSEIYDVPGNMDLSAAQKAQRAHEVYDPFTEALNQVVDAKSNHDQAPILVTIHSFTPVYFGEPRQVELGILHSSDSRLADAMLKVAPEDSTLVVRRNQPYGPEDGVTHTLDIHGNDKGHMNVMIEVRNDLVKSEEEVLKLSNILADMITDAITQVEGATACQ